MRCTTARKYICMNRDGMLDEAARIKLQRHLAACPACAAWCGEMEECMKLLLELPELEPSENFEWNLKRRIAMERSRTLRREASVPFGARAWGARFLSGAAAALVVTVAAALLFGIRGPQRRTESAMESGARAQFAEQQRSKDARPSAPVVYPARIRYVSDGYSKGAEGRDAARSLPFRTAPDPRTQELLRENELLRRRVEELQRQNIIVRNLLLKCSTESGKKR